jgi:hypothetical protein
VAKQLNISKKSGKITGLFVKMAGNVDEHSRKSSESQLIIPEKKCA